jgi:hypothetical protein
MSSLIDGTLVIEIHMKLTVPAKSSPPPFIPENPSACKVIQGLFNDEESSDIVFEVGGERPQGNATNKAETTPGTFFAHRAIVRSCSSILADMCGSQGDGTTRIDISGISPDVFHLLLFYMYGGKVPDGDMKSHARGIIDAADNYGVTSLKLEAEASIVEDTIFTIKNVMEQFCNGAISLR